MLLFVLFSYYTKCRTTSYTIMDLKPEPNFQPDHQQNQAPMQPDPNIDGAEPKHRALIPLVLAPNKCSRVHQ